MRFALAQVNPTIGDLPGNVARAGRFIDDARRAGADLVAFPEMVVTGYPPDDLLLRADFLADSRSALQEIASATRGLGAIVGCVDQYQGRLYSAAALIQNGRILGIYRKHHLPNYGVFDERRFFLPGDEIVLGQIDGFTFGVTVCEDLWADRGPHVDCAAAGAPLILNINASPYHCGKGGERLDLLRRRARQYGVTVAYVNLVGGADEVVFDGQSTVVGPDGEIVARAGQFAEELLTFDFAPDPEAPELDLSESEAGETVVVVNMQADPGRDRPDRAPRVAPELDETAEIYQALVLGLRDYVHKNGFGQAVVGISGGIDSALTATIAADALGPSNVLGLSNPSELTSSQSTTDAKQLALNLGIELATIPIGPTLTAMRRTLGEEFGRTEYSVADQNLQARIRGTLWMFVSNLTGRLALATGNKSEMAVGYATLYGDMAGAFAVLKDVPKTLVYRLAEWRNREGEPIPASILDRPPTAELAPGQLDTDALPPYAVLDPILEAYVEANRSIDQVTALGYERETVVRVARMVDRAEYKRRQAPPGVKISRRAFGRDRRLPITNRYESS